MPVRREIKRERQKAAYQKVKGRGQEPLRVLGSRPAWKIEKGDKLGTELPSKTTVLGHNMATWNQHWKLDNAIRGIKKPKLPP